ncbi:MAG: hypothetical protein U0T61_02000 [Buchnera aphidicola (Melaphis rhois)]
MTHISTFLPIFGPVITDILFSLDKQIELEINRVLKIVSTTGCLLSCNDTPYQFTIIGLT